MDVFCFENMPIIAYHLLWFCYPTVCKKSTLGKRRKPDEWLWNALQASPFSRVNIYIDVDNQDVSLGK